MYELRQFVTGLLGVYALLLTQWALAEPDGYLPKHEGEVVQTLPKPVTELDPQLEFLRLRLQRQPDNYALSLRVARHYMKLAVNESDPRYYGYAQSALAKWWHLPEPPLDVLMLKVSFLQSRLQYQQALEILALVLARQPDHTAALLTQALIYRALGEYQQALLACNAMQSESDSVSYAVCRASIERLNGNLEQAYQALQTLLPATVFAGPGMRQWVLMELALAAEQQGLMQQANDYFRQALSIQIYDVELLGFYADYLLALQRYPQVLDLLANEKQNETLLLRWLLAAQALEGAASIREQNAYLQARFDAAQLRKDTVHLPDEVRFMLDISGQARSALSLARKSWVVQKTIQDLRIFLRAAVEAGDPQSVADVIAWVKVKGIQDQALTQVMAQLKPK